MSLEHELAELNSIYQTSLEHIERLEKLALDARTLLIVCADVLAHDVAGGAKGLVGQIEAWREEAKQMIGEIE